MKIKPLQWYWRIADLLLVPLMWFVNGGKKPLQRTHHWHMQKVEPNPQNMPQHGVLVTGNDTATLNHSHAGAGLPHIPILGGLTRIKIIEAATESYPWYIGWATPNPVQAPYHIINRLPLHTPRVAILAGNVNYKTTIFAVDETGKELPVAVVGEGKLGDKELANIPLV